MNDRFMRFDNEDRHQERHQEKKLYANSNNFYGINSGPASKLVSVSFIFFVLPSFFCIVVAFIHFLVYNSLLFLNE